MNDFKKMLKDAIVEVVLESPVYRSQIQIVQRVIDYVQGALADPGLIAAHQKDTGRSLDQWTEKDVQTIQLIMTFKLIDIGVIPAFLESMRTMHQLIGELIEEWYRGTPPDPIWKELGLKVKSLHHPSEKPARS